MPRMKLNSGIVKEWSSIREPETLMVDDRSIAYPANNKAMFGLIFTQ